MTLFKSVTYLSLLFLLSNCAGKDAAELKIFKSGQSCVFAAKNTEMKHYPHCLELNTKTDQHYLAKQYFKIIQTKSEQGLIYLFMNDFGWAYVKPDRELVYTPVRDNGPDYISEGLFRYYSKNKKIGFMDQFFQVIINPGEWDWVSPFDKSVAVFCRGCVLKKKDMHDEHPKRVGGYWGVIDKQGKVVVSPVKYEQWSFSLADNAAKKIIPLK